MENSSKGKQMGMKVNGAFFNADGNVLSWENFVEKIESVGLEYGGETSPIDDEGNVYEVVDMKDWTLGKIIKNEFE